MTFCCEVSHYDFTELSTRACSVKVWCTKIARILRIMVQTGINLAVDRVTNIITKVYFIFRKIENQGFPLPFAYVLSFVNKP